MSSLRGLLIDDDADIRFIAAMSPRRLGTMEVGEAGSGRAGFAMAADRAPDVILLDVMMPEMDGERTPALLQSDPRTAAVPVVFMTAKVMGDEIARWSGLEGCGVIRKALDPVALPRLLSEAMQSPSR